MMHTVKKNNEEDALDGESTALSARALCRMEPQRRRYISLEHLLPLSHTQDFLSQNLCTVFCLTKLYLYQPTGWNVP